MIREDIQLLRGVAVLLVVLFHLGLSAFDSGFLGVDVFFVISGYLMARMYNPAQPSAFFVKRGRRLLPAYFATIFATVVATALIATPNELDQVISQAWYSLLFVPNIGFWATNSYFDKAEFRPLLHLWSLGVELQFYALVPLVYLYARRFRLLGLAVLIAASAALCFVIVGFSMKTSFFWLPTRMWEFLFGFGVGLALGARTLEGRLVPWLGLIGLIVIVLIPTVPVDGEAQGFVHGHPGLSALGVTLATTLVVACGLPGWLQRSLPARGLERLGDWSYSIYLAHYPVLVLLYYQPFLGTRTQASSLSELGVALLAVALASTLLYRLVERPLRPQPLGRPALIAGVTALLLVLLPGPAVVDLSLDEQQRTILAARDDRDVYRCGKSWRVMHPKAEVCPLNAPEHRTMSVYLVGNSHADALKQAFTEAANARGVQVFLTVDNSPLMNRVRFGASRIVQHAVDQGASAIVLHFSGEVLTPEMIEEVAREADRRGIVTDLIMPVPAPTEHVPRNLWNAHLQGRSPALTTLAQYRKEQQALIEGLPRIQVPHFRVYEVAQTYCSDNCAITDEHGVPYYHDDSHLTLTGSRKLRETFDRLLGDLLAEPDKGQRPGGGPPERSNEPAAGLPRAAL